MYEQQLHSTPSKFGPVEDISAAIKAQASASMPPLTERIGERLSEVQKLLSEAHYTQENLLGRLFGPRPNGDGPCAPEPSSLVDRLLDQLSDLMVQARAVMANAQELNNRI